MCNMLSNINNLSYILLYYMETLLTKIKHQAELCFRVKEITTNSHQLMIQE